MKKGKKRVKAKRLWRQILVFQPELGANMREGKPYLMLPHSHC
uniref:Uncharacterized protein n=1 Tax=Yersinia ruckeri TaxID=29486 RepID=A0A0A8VHL9_YERRU|nr:hypothetical protein CSF007_10590 [Yersinia ruckeri]